MSSPMARILSVEDETDIRTVLELALTRAGHEVVQAGDGATALELARTRSPELVLLDLMLPDVSGTEVCRQLKRLAPTSAVPVIMLTARGEEVDRVVGFELGADDYVTKPFSVRELMLRVDAVLRRAGGRAAPSPEPERQATPPRAERLVFGRLAVSPEAHRVWVDGDEVELTALEMRLLLTLFERKDRVQSRSVLLDDVWGITADITTRTVDTHVKRLREKLGPAGEYIETVRGVGYRFANAPGGPPREGPHDDA
jgi:two-component system phosphate regulon response regulator PhoB